MSKRELAIAFILIVGILVPILSLFPSADGLTLFPQDQNISIVDTHDDRWITETGRLFDSPLVQILDPNQDLVSYLIFRGVEINFWEPLSPGNATLRLYTTSNQSFDDSSVTIYGMKVDELQTISVGASFVLSVPYTTAHVVYPTGNFTGAKWHDINVTAIVEELIRAHNWDGDGVTGTETGDAIGFVILGAKGSDPRWFQDYRSYPPNSADLRIRWNHQPPLIDPPDDYEYVEQYRNYSIWKIPGNTTLEYTFIEGTDPFNQKFDTVHTAPSNAVSISDCESYGPTALFSVSYSRKIVRSSDGTLYVIYKRELAGKDQIFVKKSIDSGTTWIDENRISTLDGMNLYDSYAPALAIDSNDHLHALWKGYATGFLDRVYLWYANYTGSWSEPTTMPPGAAVGSNSFPSIAIDSDDNLHLVYGAGTPMKIWYQNRTDSWSDLLTLNLVDGMQDYGGGPATIEVDSNDNLHVAFRAGSDTYPTKAQIWYKNRTSVWSTEIRISTAEGMGGFSQQFLSLAVNYTDNVKVVWPGRATGYANTQIWCAERNATGWGTPIRISTVDGMSTNDQDFPSITLDKNNNTHVLWSGKATDYLDNNKIWYAQYTESWQTPQVLQPIGRNEHPSIVLPEQIVIDDDSYFNTNSTGDIVQGPFDTIQEAQECIETKMGPDPTDPDPIGWPIEGPFIRFRMRLYFLIIGYGCVWGPIWFFCWKRPSGYYICVAFIIMLMGLGLLLQIPNV